MHNFMEGTMQLTAEMLKTEVKFVIRCSGHPSVPVKQGLGVTRTAPCHCWCSSWHGVARILF